MKSKIHLFIFIHTLAALLLVLFYSKFTNLSVISILIHTLAICSIYIVLLYCTPHKFIYLSLSILSIVLVFFYLANFIAIQNWNGVITWSFLVNNLSVFTRELQKFPIYVFVALLIPPLFIVKVYRKFLVLEPDFRQYFGVLPLTPLLVGSFYYSIYFMQEDMSATLEGELIFEFFNDKNKPTTEGDYAGVSVLTGTKITMKSIKNRPNIILIHGDALRADRLSAYGNPRKTTPFIDKLVNRKKGIKIANSMSNCSETICGIASVTTSNFSYKNKAENIFNILSDDGYINNFIGTGDLYHGGLDRYLNPLVHNLFRADLNDKYYKHDDRFVIDTLSAYPTLSEQPQLIYLRMMSSHPLGAHRQKYKKYQPTPNSLFSFEFLGGNVLQAQLNAHDNFASQFDGYVQDVFSILESKGYLENAIVVIFGDHGDAMGEHGYQGHFKGLYQEEIHVPIILWSSNNIDIGVNTNSFATLMDIPATLLHYLDIPIPKSFLGEPLQIDNKEKLAYLDSKRDTVGVVYQKNELLYKLFISKKDIQPLHLFELKNDPGELLDVHEKNIEITKKLINSYKEFKQTQTIPLTH